MRKVAPSGKQGAGSNRDGAAGADLEVKVPDGTVVLDEDGRVLADMVGAGTRFEAASGGRGGLGNAALASRARKAPGFALLGEKGEIRDLTLELKTVADVGLVGFPSAGKSSLVSTISAAKPKVADYPFTTLAPNLGVVSAGEQTFTVADVPGLKCGAGGCAVRDVWRQQDNGTATGQLATDLAPHQTAYMVLSAGSAGSALSPIFESFWAAISRVIELRLFRSVI